MRSRAPRAKPAPRSPWCPAPPRSTTPHGVRRIDVQSAQQMLDAVMAGIPGQHVFIGVAAVADWRVENASAQKIKKDGSGDAPQLQFAQNPDILATVAGTTSLNGWPYCVGFAAESENLIEYGAAKREKKGIPLLVGNIGHHTFGQDENAIVLFDDSGHTVLPQAPQAAAGAPAGLRNRQAPRTALAADLTTHQRTQDALHHP